MQEKIKSKYFPSGYKPDGSLITNTEEDYKLNPSHPEYYYRKYGNSKYKYVDVKENKKDDKK